MNINAKKLAGKIAVITGASRGIGNATALRLAKDGATVAIHFAREEKAAQEAVASIQTDGGDAFVVQAELSTQAGIEAWSGTGIPKRLGSASGHDEYGNAIC